jgi:iron only hydrogenase large subunit-like protein
MVAQIAPAVRVAIAETIGLAPGDVTVGQLVTALKQLGFDYVFGACPTPLDAPRGRRTFAACLA